MPLNEVTQDTYLSTVLGLTAKYNRPIRPPGIVPYRCHLDGTSTWLTRIEYKNLRLAVKCICAHLAEIIAAPRFPASGSGMRFLQSHKMTEGRAGLAVVYSTPVHKNLVIISLNDFPMTLAGFSKHFTKFGKYTVPTTLETLDQALASYEPLTILLTTNLLAVKQMNYSQYAANGQNNGLQSVLFDHIFIIGDRASQINRRLDSMLHSRYVWFFPDSAGIQPKTTSGHWVNDIANSICCSPSVLSTLTLTGDYDRNDTLYGSSYLSDALVRPIEPVFNPIDFLENPTTTGLGFLEEVLRTDPALPRPGQCGICLEEYDEMSDQSTQNVLLEVITSCCRKSICVQCYSGLREVKNATSNETCPYCRAPQFKAEFGQGAREAVERAVLQLDPSRVADPTVYRSNVIAAIVALAMDTKLHRNICDRHIIVLDQPAEVYHSQFNQQLITAVKSASGPTHKVINYVGRERTCKDEKWCTCPRSMSWTRKAQLALINNMIGVGVRAGVASKTIFVDLDTVVDNGLHNFREIPGLRWSLVSMAGHRPVFKTMGAEDLTVYIDASSLVCSAVAGNFEKLVRSFKTHTNILVE